MKLIYHRDCPDGFCAAFLFWLWEAEDSRTEYIAAQYGEGLPQVRFDESELVLIADFSYPPDLMQELASKVKKVIVLDHHKTAIDSYKSPVAGDEYKFVGSNVTLTFDETKCGSRLMYEYLESFRSHRTDWKWLVDYVEDRDLWKWWLENSKEISAAIASYPKDFKAWETFDKQTLIKEGSAILRYQNQLTEGLAKNVRFVDGIPTLNSPVMQSELGNLLSKDRAYADIWYINEKGEKIHSLRSQSDGWDVSEVAKAFGGGGHRCAAGYKEGVK